MKWLAAARLTALHFKHAVLRIGLSWPSLSKALGRPVADPSRWAVLYLGSAKVSDLETERDIVAIDEAKRRIYFTAGGRDPGNPYYRYLYRVAFDGSDLTPLTPEPAHPGEAGGGRQVHGPREIDVAEARIGLQPDVAEGEFPQGFGGGEEGGIETHGRPSLAAERRRV